MSKYRPEVVMQVQRALKGLGLLNGPADGMYGRATRLAVRSFQRLHPPLTIDGYIGPKTWEVLFPKPIPDRQLPTPVDDTAVQHESDKLEEGKKQADLTVASQVHNPSVQRPIEGGGPAGSWPVHNLWPKQVDCMSFYGPVGTSQVMVPLPYQMRLAWDKSKIVSKVSVHQKVALSVTRCFHRIAEIYTPTEISTLGLDLFGGSLNVRKMRGGNSWSMHSWGIAIDMNPAWNQLTWHHDHNPAPRLSMADAKKYWEVWEAEGWVSLGRSRDYDWMHVQAARL